MSEHAQTNTNGGEPQVRRQRKPRGPRDPNAVRPHYVVCQMTDENGQPVRFEKRRLKIIGVERDPNKVLLMTDAEDNKHMFYLRIDLPPGTRAGSPNRPKAD